MGKYSAYMEAQSLDLRSQFNRIIRDVLRTAFVALEQNTFQDSGRAAYHWRILPVDTGRGAPRWKAEYRADVRGQSPVGQRGDYGRHRQAVVNYVVGREQEVIDRVVKGRNPRARFLFFNPIQAADPLYSRNAELEEAVEVAQGVARSRMEQMAEVYGIRKRSLK